MPELQALGERSRQKRLRAPTCASTKGNESVLFVGAGLVPARLSVYAARWATTTRAFTPVFDGLRVAPTNAEVVQPLHFN
jgi:hypothetical protein